MNLFMRSLRMELLLEISFIDCSLVRRDIYFVFVYCYFVCNFVVWWVDLNLSEEEMVELKKYVVCLMDCFIDLMYDY